MLSRRNGGRPLSPIVLTLAAGIGIFGGPTAEAGDGGGAGAVPRCGQCGRLHPARGSGGGGLFHRQGVGRDRDFQGFGLGFHLGHGYGGHALGVGPDGGHPLYGGPGYPHAEPPLRRRKGIVPFPYYGGPGAPSPGHPQYFGGAGPLLVDPPVVKLGTPDGYPSDPAGTGYGAYTGAIPYPDTAFGPFSASPVYSADPGRPGLPAPRSPE